jgi:hypothetical protein
MRQMRQQGKGIVGFGSHQRRVKCSEKSGPEQVDTNPTRPDKLDCKRKDDKQKKWNQKEFETDFVPSHLLCDSLWVLLFWLRLWVLSLCWVFCLMELTRISSIVSFGSLLPNQAATEI